MSYTYAYPRPAVTVDCIVFGLEGSETPPELRVLLIERKGQPFAGHWALPGGFIDMEEDLEAAARRELAEETGVEPAWLEQLYTFGTPGRDPRGRVITVAYLALVKQSGHRLTASSDAARAEWFSVTRPPKLAFDHKEVLAVALERLRSKVRWQPIGFDLLPPTFTLSALQGLYETVLGETLDKRNFRKKVLSLGFVVPTGKVEQNVPRRPAQLYAFDRKRYLKLHKEGFEFRI